MNTSTKVIRYNQQVMDGMFGKPDAPMTLKTRKREPDFQWDTTALGVPVTVDIYCVYQRGDRGDIYNPPEKKGEVVEYAMIGSDRIDDEMLIDACQRFVDENE